MACYTNISVLIYLQNIEKIFKFIFMCFGVVVRNFDVTRSILYATTIVQLNQFSNEFSRTYLDRTDQTKSTLLTTLQTLERNKIYSAVIFVANSLVKTNTIHTYVCMHTSI